MFFDDLFDVSMLLRVSIAFQVVGNADTLMQSEDWAALIADAKARKCFMDLDSILKDFFSLFDWLVRIVAGSFM